MSLRIQTKLALSLVACTAMTSCGSIPKQKFIFDAIDLNEQPRACLIVVDDEWDAAAEKGQIVNVTGDDQLDVMIEFRQAEVEITVAPLTVDGNTVTMMPTSRTQAIQMSSFKDDLPRKLRLGDPSKHVFVLQPK